MTRESVGLRAECLLTAFSYDYEADDLIRDAKAFTGAVWLAKLIEVLLKAHTQPR